METFTMEDLVESVKENNYDKFKSNKDLLPENIMKFVDLLDNKEKEIVINWCKEENIYLIHRILTTVETIDSISFIKENLALYKKHHLRDDRKKTWLHIAVKYNRGLDILKYLLEDLGMDVEKIDDNKLTALHLACSKTDYIEGELNLLIKKSDQLIACSLDDVSPLELACGDMKKMKEIKRNKIVNIKELLCKLDDNSNGLMETDNYDINFKTSIETMYVTLLQKNDKHRLINRIKNDENFKDKYYLSENSFIKILKGSLENGQGIITHIKDRYMNGIESQLSLENLFLNLTGLKKEEENTKNLDVDNDNVYYKSGLFLAVITGRFELVPILLTYCQFDIIPYALLTCVICINLSTFNEFSNQVVDNLIKTKIFCEKYAISVLNRIVIRDLTLERKTTTGFLIKPYQISGKCILDIASLGKCSKFVSIPICQTTLTNLWYEKNRKCPALKFYIHSLVHCIFLALLSFVLVHDFYAKISIKECLCYVYGFGYLVEEMRQIYVCYTKHGVKSYGDEASNFLDVGALLTMLTAGILRIALKIETFPNEGEQGLFKESNDINLFVIRLILCISLILFYMRVIYFGSIFEQLGPKLEMIGQMIVRDLIPLIFIFFIFIVSFGVAFQSLMFPNNFYPTKGNNTFVKQPTSFIIGHIFRRSTYTIFDTHYPFEELDHDEAGYVVNMEGKVSVYLLLIIYMVVVNIMLTNLLIALFSHTVSVIIQKSRDAWKAKRYKDIKEYFDRSLLPPPLNLFEINIEIISELLQRHKVKKSLKIKSDDQQMEILEGEIEELQKDQFTSFKIIQAFALKDCRYKLITNEEDEEYERKNEIKTIKQSIGQIESILREKRMNSLKNK